MLKKTIKYTDYNGVDRTETFYFNLSRGELIELELSVNGGFTEMLDKIIQSQDAPEIMKWFKKIIMMSYGVKSDDGKRFIKSDELSEAFVQTEAYSNLLMSFMEDASTAAEFVNGIMPQSLETTPTN